MAWLSSSTVNAIDRITGTGPWYLVDGTLAFASKAALTSPPQVAIDLDEHGAQPPGPENVWTGTHADGTVSAGFTCSDWTSNAGNASALTGLRVATDTTWSEQYNLLCSNTLPRLYCFEQ